MASLLTTTVKSIFIVLLVSLATLIATVLIGVKIDLESMRDGIEASLGSALGREARINGPLELEISVEPAIRIGGLSIANIAAAKQPFFLQADHAHLRLAIRPLLRGEFTIADITAEQVTLNLQNDTAGNPNWIFAEAEATAGKEAPLPEDTQAAKRKRLITFTGLDHLALSNISVHYYDAALHRNVAFALDTMTGSAAAGQPIILTFNGHLQNKTYDLTLRGGSIRELLDTEKPWAFDLSGEVIDREMIAKGELLRGGSEPEVKLAFGMRDVDVGAILGALGLVDGMQAKLGDAGFKLELKGDSLYEILQQSSMAFKVRGGSWHVQVPNSDAGFDIDQLYGDIRVERGNAISMQLDGTIDSVPVELSLAGAPLVEYIKDQKEIPLSIDAKLLDSRIQFDGNVKLPISTRDISLALRVNSVQIDRFNELLSLQLPSLGPIELVSALHISERGYDLNTLTISVGDSHLDGQLLLDTARHKPKIEATLVSPMLQLDDFASTRDNTLVDSDAIEQAEQTADKASEPATDKDALAPLSFTVLNAFDANVSVTAQDVRSGEDKLGSAQMQIELKNARLAVAPLIVNVPGGSARLTADYQPSLIDVTVNAQANVEEFDAGVLVRRTRPQSTMGGKLTLDAGLHSQAPDLATLMEHASGHIDFALVPENFASDVIDLWAVNLLSAIISKSTEQDQSEVNCLVARVNMEDGILHEKAIYMDTSNMRIAGESVINFKSRELEVIMVPKAKKPEFFSMAVPIKVAGTFDDFGLKLSAARTAGQVISFITSPIHVPIRRAVVEEVPSDGAAACRAAWELEPDDTTSE